MRTATKKIAPIDGCAKEAKIVKAGWQIVCKVLDALLKDFTGSLRATSSTESDKLARPANVDIDTDAVSCRRQVASGRTKATVAQLQLQLQYFQ